MKTHRKAFAALVVLMLATGGRASAYFPDTVVRGVVHRWAEPSAAAARKLLEEYKLPDDVTLNRITWYDRGYWKRTVVWNQKPVYRSLNDLDIVEQTVDYPLTSAQAEELLAFRDGLTVDMESGELSSRSDREAVNFLTLNLADEIVRGRKTVAQARDSYERILSLAASGKVSPYMTRLLFRSPQPLSRD